MYVFLDFARNNFDPLFSFAAYRPRQFFVCVGLHLFSEFLKHFPFFCL